MILERILLAFNHKIPKHVVAPPHILGEIPFARLSFFAYIKPEEERTDAKCPPSHRTTGGWRIMRPPLHERSSTITVPAERHTPPLD